MSSRRSSRRSGGKGSSGLTLGYVPGPRGSRVRELEPGLALERVKLGEGLIDRPKFSFKLSSHESRCGCFSSE